MLFARSDCIGIYRDLRARVSSHLAYGRTHVGDHHHARLVFRHHNKIILIRASSCNDACEVFSATLPKGAVIASHSWREMAATWPAFMRGMTRCGVRVMASGWIMDVNTMWNSYIRPYKEVFPYSAFLAEVFDFLRAA